MRGRCYIGAGQGCESEKTYPQAQYAPVIGAAHTMMVSIFRRGFMGTNPGPLALALRIKGR